MRKVIYGVLPILVIASTLAIGQGVRTWYGNEGFMSQLDASIASFFGNSVGTYLPAESSAYVSVDAHANSIVDKTKIANQFLAIFGHGAPGMQQLSNKKTLYEYSAAPQDGNLRVAIVTPQYSTNVLAAAMVHYGCGYLSRRDVKNTVKVQKHSTGPGCNRYIVTVFFQNQASRNSIIRKELVRWGTLPLLDMCRHDLVHTVYRRAYVAKHGHQPPRCSATSHLVVLNP